MQSFFHYSHWLPRLAVSVLLTLATVPTPTLVMAAGDPADLGEQFFLETRFSQFFKIFLDQNVIPPNEVNDELPSGDPRLKYIVNWKVNENEFLESDIPSMNCRFCHLVDEFLDNEDHGMRTYTDFARRSPVPARNDLKETTVRNSPPLVNASLDRKVPFFLHFDAEFPSMQALVEGTLTGRNFGWLPTEKKAAIDHVARILREDNGSLLDPEIFGEKLISGDTPSYREFLTGDYGGDNPFPEFELPDDLRVAADVFDTISDENNKILFEAVAGMIAAYTEGLEFANISPYDIFLEKNGLPTGPQYGQTNIQYSRHLLKEIKKREKNGSLEYVMDEDNPGPEGDFPGGFVHHDKPYVFGPEELKGLKIFFSEGKKFKSKFFGGKFFGKHFYGSKFGKKYKGHYARRGVGNCIACHAAPTFTDFKFHNTGIAQAEYDSVHYKGAFKKLRIPGFYKRNANPNKYLPATEQHPNAKEPFRAIPQKDNKYLTDLGVWNIFANRDFPDVQPTLKRLLCKQQKKYSFFHYWKGHRACHPRRLLPKTIALFKTPGLRDLGHSAPYSHTGQVDTIEDVIQGYIDNSKLARAYKLRNGDPEMKNIKLRSKDIAPLAAFIKSLDEDYE